MKRVAATVSLLLCPAIVLGHHSRAECADKTAEIEGVLTDVIWRNPQIALFLNELNADGEESWRVETFGAPGSFEDSGVSPESFQIGERLTIAGRVERNSPSADGRTLTVEYTVEEPVYLSESYTSSVDLVRVADDAPIYDYVCEPDSAERFSRNP